MIFQTLYFSALRGELLLVNGGFCHWHLRKDGQLTIREIIVLPKHQNEGIGTQMLEELKTVKGATSILSRCPADLLANKWYKNRGFVLCAKQLSRTKRKINVWRLDL
ncbi:MAG: N-acetyltransferase [Thermodesulfobacteriales bacterium]|nr:MAG: N-acetyltransferase [Thermodesulfobacteriales bacterium]